MEEHKSWTWPSILHYNNSLSICPPSLQFLAPVVTEKNATQICMFKTSNKRKMEEYREEQDSEARFSIPHYNNSLSICKPNMNLLTLLVAEKCVTQIFSLQNVEKNKWINTMMNTSQDLGSQFNDTTTHCLSVHQVWIFAPIVTEKSVIQICTFKIRNERKMNKYREE